jgi:hypothetical protein
LTLKPTNARTRLYLTGWKGHVISLTEAIATQPQWIQIWLNWLGPVTFFLPLTLFIWRETRGATIFLIIAALLNLSGILLLNSLTGYTRLLGLPHVLFWTPAAFHIFIVLRRGVPRIPSIDYRGDPCHHPDQPCL